MNHRPSLYMMNGAILVATISLSLSAYFFTGFLGGGRSWIGIIQSFLLCFGVGSVFFAPAILLFFMARHVRIFGPKHSIGYAGIFIALPLWVNGGWALIFKLPYTPYAILILGLGLCVLWWSLTVLQAALQIASQNGKSKIT